MSLYVDITEFVNDPHRTGIQRVTAELVRNWPDSSELIPVRVTRDARLVRLPNETLPLIQAYFTADFDNGDIGARIMELNKSVEITGLPVHLAEKDILLCPEVFFDPVRIYYYESRPASLHKSYCFIIYDILPLTHPEFFPKEGAHHLICRYFRLIRDIRNLAYISQTTQIAFSERLLRSDRKHGIVTWLGSDSLGPRPRFQNEVVDRAPHFVVVGTIEPRKNHLTILKAFEPLFDRIPELRLTFVGRMGWLGSDDVTRIETARSRYRGFNVCSVANDATLQHYIRSARATVFASVAEGFGLPPLESLWLGTPVICSGSTPSLQVCGTSGVDIVEPLTAANIQRAALNFLDPSYAIKKVREAQALQLPTWKSFALTVRDWVHEVRSSF